MNPLLNSYSFSLEKPPKKRRQHSSSQLPAINNFFLSNIITTNHRSRDHHSHHKRTKTVRYAYINTQPSMNIRKDIYGNKIEKGGNHKISFKDNIKGKQLVETTLIDLKKNVIKNKKGYKYEKKDFIIRETNDKEKIICSSACNIY